MVNIHTWILVLGCFIAITQSAVNEGLADDNIVSDRKSVVDAVVGFIRRNSVSDTKRNSVSAIKPVLDDDSGRRNRGSELRGTGTVGTHGKITSAKVNSPVSNSNTRKRAVMAVHKKKRGKIIKSDDDDDDREDDYSQSTDKENIDNGNDSDSNDDCDSDSDNKSDSDDDSKDDNNSSDEDCDDDQKAKEDGTEDCGIFGCGGQSPWQGAPERVWQGVKSGLSDWTIKPIKSKYSRGRPVGKGYSDNIFGPNFL